jgi:hypothetical protein
MFLFVLLPLLVVLGMVLIAAPALLPFAVVIAAGLGVARVVVRHRHPDQTVHPH